MYNGPIVKAAVHPGFDDNHKGNPIRIYARIQEDITMKQDIYDLTVAYILENQEKCYRLAYSYVQNREDALDVVQESACKAICQCNSLKDPSKLYSWICRIVVNTTMDLLRSRKKEDLPGELPEQASEDVYQETDLKNALESLEPQNRTIVVLRYCEDMKLEDIALAVNENLSTVKPGFTVL